MMIRPFFAALTMLTVIPVPGFNATENDLERCKPCLPLIGLLAGALIGVAAWLLSMAFPPTVASVGTIIAMTLLSKGFHLDGLADTADGFMSSRPRERILEIMHDSHIGTMGVLAIVAVLGLKAGAALSIPPSCLPLAAGFAALSGRCAIVLYIQVSRYARESGLGQIMFRRKSVVACLWTSAIWYGAAWIISGVPGLIITSVLLAFPFLWAIYTRKKIGGATGDTIGACEELTEMATLLLFTCQLFF